MQNLGLTGEEAGEMTLDEVQDLFAYWRRVPPMNETMYVFAGGDAKKMAPEAEAEKRTPSEAEIREMVRMMNGGRG